MTTTSNQCVVCGSRTQEDWPVCEDHLDQWVWDNPREVIRLREAHCPRVQAQFMGQSSGVLVLVPSRPREGLPKGEIAQFWSTTLASLDQLWFWLSTEESLVTADWAEENGYPKFAEVLRKTPTTSSGPQEFHFESDKPENPY